MRTEIHIRQQMRFLYSTNISVKALTSRDCTPTAFYHMWSQLMCVFERSGHISGAIHVQVHFPRAPTLIEGQYFGGTNIRSGKIIPPRSRSNHDTECDSGTPGDGMLCLGSGNKYTRVCVRRGDSDIVLYPSLFSSAFCRFW